MRFLVLFFLVLIAGVSLTLAQGSFEDCCLKYVKRVQPQILRRIKDYRHQEADGGCNIRAIYFSYNKKRGFCADPKQPWVKHVIKRLDKYKKKHNDQREKA